MNRPDKATLLDAVAEFLTDELRPHVKDKALSFRVLIAANLAGIVAREIRVEEKHDSAQMLRLRRLLPDIDVAQSIKGNRPSARAEAMSALNAAMIERLRAGQFDERQREQVWGHVTETLREKLSVLNPRFDTAPHVE
ncbi:MAG: hypothetical protein ACI9WU_000168 [Myxococcota bacterium]|jgi:hypothetical protein